MILEETMNPNFNWAIVAERMQALQVEAQTVTRTRHAARIRRVTRTPGSSDAPAECWRLSRPARAGSTRAPYTES